MRHDEVFAPRAHSFAGRRHLIGAVVLALAFPIAAQAADARRGERGGKEIVDEVCSKCHATGAQGAPKIGDQKAWEQRSSRGLTALTQNALKGVRNMPPHGARLDLTDEELKRAITYMVNQSGGHWIEPVSRTAKVTPRTGKQIVEMRCSQCHAAGKGGAPRIGERADWIPRLSRGFDATVRSAIHGHGGMPPRGGLADLTDFEMRAAITYMFNPDPVAKK